jgi:hypothetical protein
VVGFGEHVEKTAGNMTMKDEQRAYEIPLVRVPRVIRKPEIVRILDEARLVAGRYGSTEYLTAFPGPAIRSGWVSLAGGLVGRMAEACAELGGGLVDDDEVGFRASP